MDAKPAAKAEAARAAMVRAQIERRGVRDPRVLEAMRRVPRECFVPQALAAHAFEDRPLPLGAGQTISQPYIVALMTALIEPGPDDVVFEAGTGSGYQTAVLASIVRHVYTVERVPGLAREAGARLHALGFGPRVSARTGDARLGWPEAAPFDAILVTAAPEEPPAALMAQLRPGGRMVVPVGPRDGVQDLRRIRVSADGAAASESILPVRFVPMG
jgi:protein-L-isoaspartate(D-aspartate) O-methyltransferase